MAYVEPTAASIKNLFPEFAQVADSVITAAITTAKLYVDRRWSETTYTFALSLRTAHQMTLQGLGTKSRLDALNIDGVSSFSIDDLSVSISDTAVEAKLGQDEGATKYGRQLRELRSIYFNGTHIP